MLIINPIYTAVNITQREREGGRRGLIYINNSIQYDQPMGEQEELTNPDPMIFSRHAAIQLKMCLNCMSGGTSNSLLKGSDEKVTAQEM